MRSGIRTLGIALGAVAFLLCLAGNATAQTYTVTRTDDPTPAPCEPTDCSLRNALMAANSSTTVDDVVVLPASSTPYVLQYEELSLPIADEVEVRGAGADKTVVKGDGKESIFSIGPFKTTLTGMTITGGRSAIQNNGELQVRGVSIEGNRWNGGTAGIITNGLLAVESSFLGFNNTESASGGVIHANAAVTIVNSTIAQNTSKEGAGAISGNGAVTITNSAIVSNRSETLTAPAVGGSPLTVRNSVFSDNRNAAGVLSCFSFMPITSLGGNVSDDASCGAKPGDRAIVLPGLGTLALHGDTTPVYDLLAGSPAIDFASQCPAVDQRSVARPQGAACDSGPYELVPGLAAVPPPVDREFSMKVGKKLRVVKRGVRVKLTCPSGEVSPPCRGKVTLSGLPSPAGRSGVQALNVRKKSAKFSIGAGKTKAVLVRLPRAVAEALSTRGRLKKGVLIVRAEDAVGNKWDLLRRAPALRAKRG